MKKTGLVIGLGFLMLACMGAPTSGTRLQALWIKYQAKSLVAELNSSFLAELRNESADKNALLEKYTTRAQTLSDSFYNDAVVVATADAETNHLIGEIQQFMSDIRVRYTAN